MTVSYQATAADLRERLDGLIPDGYEPNGVVQQSNGPGTYAAITFQLRKKQPIFQLVPVDQFEAADLDVGYGRSRTDVFPCLYHREVGNTLTDFQWYAIRKVEESA